MSCYRYGLGASAFGVYASDRDGGGYHSGLYAADSYWQIDPSDTLTALLGASSTSYPQEVASAFGFSPGTVKGELWTLDYARTRHNYSFEVNLSHVADGFRADLGYVPQVGYDRFFEPNTRPRFTSTPLGTTSITRAGASSSISMGWMRSRSRLTG